MEIVLQLSEEGPSLIPHTNNMTPRPMGSGRVRPGNGVRNYKMTPPPSCAARLGQGATSTVLGAGVEVSTELVSDPHGGV